jgi:hypothetical protein
MTIIERARACVATRPAAIEGQGGNATTFGVASLLVWGFALQPSEALGVMMEYNGRCEPPWSQRELERMLASALQRGGDKPRGHMVGDGEHVRGELVEIEAQEAKPKRTKVKFDLQKLRDVQEPRLPQSMKAWRGYLQMRCEPRLRDVTAEQFLDALYEPGERVLVFNSMRTAGDYCRVIGESTWKLGQSPDEPRVQVASLPGGSPEGMNFFMQPVTGGWKRKMGSTELSRRTAQNVTRWPYLLLESDSAPHELWLNALVRMRLRVVAIVASGGRSLHAIVKLDKSTEAELRWEIENPDNEETLITLGCDPQALKTMVYPRLPNTWREGKRMGVKGEDGKVKRDSKGKAIVRFQPFPHGRAMQSLLYFNPSAARGGCIMEGMIFEHGE